MTTSKPSAQLVSQFISETKRLTAGSTYGQLLSSILTDLNPGSTCHLMHWGEEQWIARVMFGEPIGIGVETVSHVDFIDDDPNFAALGLVKLVTALYRRAV